MNKLPEDWQIKTLNEVCNIYTGNSINKKKKEENFIGLKEGLNYIGTKDISFNNIIEYENGVKIPFKDLKDFKIAKSNTSLLCIEGGSAGRKIGFTNQDVCFGNKLCCFEAIEDEPKFIYFYLQSNDFLREFNSNISGLIGGISKEKIKRIKIPIPPLEIQKEIAARLDFSFDKIEKGIKYLKLAKENIIEYKQSMLKYAFEGKLTDCNNWEIKTLGEVCEILDNIRKPINATERKQRLKKSNLRYAYYGATGQIGYIDNFLFDFEAILLGEDGAPFLEPFKNKAYIVSGKYWVNNHAHILRAKDNISINKFVCYFLNTVDYMPYVSGTTRLKLNQFSMKQIKIPIPHIETQKEIVSILDKSFESADNMLKYVEDSLDKAELLKRALLRDAFNGKI